MNGDGLQIRDIELAQAMFRQIVAGHVGEDKNLAAIKTEFFAWVTSKYKAGRFKVTVEKLIGDVLWQILNDRAGKTTPKVLEEIESGQMSIPVDAWLDQVMTVGKHRRTLIRFYRRTDGQAIVTERKGHAEDAKRSLVVVRRQVKLLDGLVRDHGSVPEAVKAGALTFPLQSDEAAS